MLINKAYYYNLVFCKTEGSGYLVAACPQRRPSPTRPAGGDRVACLLARAAAQEPQKE